MTRLICLEPADPGPAWYPFAGARPIAELRAGAWRIRDRWAGVLGTEEALIMGDHAAGFRDVDAAELLPPGPVAGPAIVVRSDFAPAGPSLDFETEPQRQQVRPAVVCIERGAGAVGDRVAEGDDRA